MRVSLMLIFAALLLNTGCANTTALEAEIVELKRRVAVLEKTGPAKGGKAKAGKSKSGKGKAKAGKGKGKGKGDKAKVGKGAKNGKGGKAKAGKGEKAKVGPKGTIAITGDATKITLDDGRRTYPVPGAAPVGLYTIKAAFAGDAALTKMATTEVKEGITTTIDCVSASRACTVIVVE